MNSTFSRLLKIEIGKAINNKFFWITLLIACLVTLSSALYVIESLQYTVEYYPQYMDDSESSLYISWIGGESFTLGFSIFFTLLPLFAVLPYGWAYYVESKSGYVGTVVTRSGKWQYFLTKYIATFVAGGLVVLIPLLLNFIVVACYYPAVTPSQMYLPYVSVLHGSLWSKLFFTYPLIFVILYLLLDFVFAGLFATMSLAVSFFIRNRIAIVLIPLFLMLLLHYCRRFTAYKLYHEISPLHYLHSTAISNPATPWIIAVQGIFFFLVTFGITMKLGVKREVL